uniref:Uncharacterized protein n=1 Tax=Florenciella parvula TaxID=236787 RepID=A0A7S2FI14_9STRA
MSKASSRHRDFLLQTLRDVENQLTTPSALKSFVESHTLTEAYPKVPSMPPSRSSDPYEDGGSLPGARSLEDPADMVPPGADAVAALAAPPFTGGPQVPLLSKGHDIEGKHVAVKCTEDQSGARPIIVFEVVYALKSMQWRLTADPVDLGLQVGAFEAMQPEEKEQLCDHLIQRLRFQGEDAIMFALE